MSNQKRQKLTLCLISIYKDCFGVHDVAILINKKSYTYPITSEYAVRVIERLIKQHKPGTALKILNKFKIESFNGYDPKEKL